MIEVAINFLALFIPASIAVGGSFLLYRKRRRDAVESLRQSLLAEIESTDNLDSVQKFLKNENRNPTHNVCPTKVYEGNTADLGLLTENEREAVVEYYTSAYLLKDMIRSWRDHNLSGKEPSGDFRNYVIRQFDRVQGLRDRAISRLQDD